MNAKFFGEYLVEKEVLTARQLKSALALQQQNNRMLGTLAVGKNYLSEEQVTDILVLQRQLNAKFGRVAVEKKFLTEDQLNELLVLQAHNHLYLGEAICRVGPVSAETINTHLNEYLRALKKHRADFERQLRSTAVSEILETVLKLSTDYFYRLGLRAKEDTLVDRDMIPTDQREHHYYAEQKINKQRHYFGFMMSEPVFQYITATLCMGMRCPTFEQQVAYLDELICHLNFNICKELKKNGTKAKHGASTSTPPAARKQAIIKMKTIIGPFYIAYYFS